MRVQPENLTAVWEGVKQEILADHPELQEARAGELAAAGVFNWFHEDWATLKEAVNDVNDVNDTEVKAKNSAPGSEGVEIQLYDRLVDWTPLYKLQQLSGAGNLLRDLEHPIVMERSIPPADIIRNRNHWRTERIDVKPATFSELKEEWANIRAEFRGRSGGEGCLYTNSQGMHALKTTFELIQQQPYPGRVDALTTTLSSALEAIDYFRDIAAVLGGKAGASVSNLANLFETAVLDAVANKKEGFAAVDTTVPGDEADPPLTYLKKLVRHEATHVWQYTVNHENPGLLSDKVIRADPDYPKLKRAFSEYYENIKPNEILAEAVAFVASGDWKESGFTSEEQGLKFINRFFSNVVIHYGKEALDSLRLTHPAIKEVIENVRRIPIRELGPGRETAKDIGSSPESVGKGSGNDSEETRDRSTIRPTQSRLAGGGIGAGAGGLRGDGPEYRALGSHDQEITNSHAKIELIAAAGPIGAGLSIEGQPRQSFTANISQTAQGMGEGSAPPFVNIAQNSATDDDRKDVVNADLIKSLQAIATIESIDPEGIRYTWRGLAIELSMIAREALAYHEIQTGNFGLLSAGNAPANSEISNGGGKHFVEALQEISNIEFLDPGQYSWKDRAVIAGTIAREALIHVNGQYASAQEASLSLQSADWDKSASDNLSLSDIREIDQGYEENDHEQYLSF